MNFLPQQQQSFDKLQSEEINNQGYNLAFR